MITDQEMWREIKNLKQEILNLKQIKRANCASKYFMYTVPQSQDFHDRWKITYKAGSQPIISEVLSDATTALTAPVNNVQYLFAYAHFSSQFVVLSTREIASIESV